MKLRIATNLELPIDAVTEAIAVLGIRRSGKSYTVRRLAEQLFRAGQQIIIVDPKGDWWGIRSSADGKSPGLPITILGGEHGDVPLESGGGEIIATLAVEENVSMLLDLAAFRKNEIPRFMTGFLETMYRLKAAERYRTPVMLIIDEADAIAPQRPFKGEERMLGAAEDIVRRGGQRGIGCTMATQRPAVLNKNVLTQCPTLIALRTTGSQDIDAIDEWIKKHGNPEKRKLLMDSIAMMPTGDAWFWSPAWPTPAGIFQRVHVLPIETFDSGATPRAGAQRIEPKQVAAVDLDALRERMAATIERQKADDPRVLHARIAELERELKKKAAAAPVIDAERESAIRKEAARSAHQQYLEPLGDAVLALEDIRKGADRLYAALDLAHNVARFIDVLTEPKRPGPPPGFGVDPPKRIAAASESSGNGSVHGAAQRILDALAELEALGVEYAPRVQVAFMAGYTNLMSKGFANAIGALRSAGSIDYPSPGTIALTDAGRPLAHAADAPRTSQELQDRLISMLGGANGRIVRELVNIYPKSMPREILAERAGYSNTASKGFANAIGRLRSLGLIDYPERGQIRAQSVLFLKA
jgi:hypothetical protein